ncbi:MAG TPA: thioesterase family protein [Planctomycetota bacterium]|nr:thioesterase family protein [Planctomycetota bacterium]
MSFKFSSEIRVRLPETDALGVVYHGYFLTYFDVARMDYLRGLGLLEPFRTGESLNLVVHASADFRSPARFDDLLVVSVRVRRIGDSSVTFEFRVTQKADARLVAEGRSVHSFIDSTNWAPTRVPDGFRAAVRGYEGSALEEKA